MVCKNIFAKKDDIMSGAIQQDFLELQGFSYNEGTFDDIFMKRWNLAPAGGSDSSANSEQDNSDAEDDGGWGDELSSVVGKNRAAALHEDDQMIPERTCEEDACLAREETKKPEQEEVDFSTLDPRKIN